MVVEGRPLINYSPGSLKGEGSPDHMMKRGTKDEPCSISPFIHYERICKMQENNNNNEA